MKKLLILFLLAVLLLTACDKPDRVSDDGVESTQESTEEITQPTEPWLDRVSIPWDGEGVLLEVPLTIPDSLHFSSSKEFDGDLLLWSFDSHLADTVVLELCVVDLHDGSVISQKDIPMSSTVLPQVLGSSLYLCDDASGTITQLDKQLKVVNTWQTEPAEGIWYMGSGEKLYIYDWDSSAFVRDLSTGETTLLLEEDPVVHNLYVDGSIAMIEYYRSDNGAETFAALDLSTGAFIDSGITDDADMISYRNGSWLLGEYEDAGYEYTLYPKDADPVTIPASQATYEFLEGGYIVSYNEEASTAGLYKPDGTRISVCKLSEQPYTYTCDNLIWSEEYGGYFLTVSTYGSDFRLLFWDITESLSGGNLELTPVPTPSEQEAMVARRAQELGEKYGVIIYVGDECDTQFDEFSATITEDWEEVNDALDILDNALSVYPEGFFRQLRWDNIYSIQIHLVTDLLADGSGRYGDEYIAFAQELWDHYLMVIDIDDCYEDTYYHEFSHIIDTYLEWDSWQREDALFSETTWISFNPAWFDGYTYDYSWEHELKDWNSFVDSYSTISPTEDRARIMEYAMSDYGEWTFTEDAEILMAKLAYYSRCIRDAFDTEGWPEMLPWEQYLR